MSELAGSAASLLELVERDGGTSFAVHVAPRASRQAVLGVHDGALKVSLTAPPVEGAANDALVSMLAKALGVPRRAVRVLHGEHGRRKTVRVESVTAEAVRAALAPTTASTPSKGSDPT